MDEVETEMNPQRRRGDAARSKISLSAPLIISGERGRDFGIGFYTTDIYEQALKWTARQGQVRSKQAILNIYEFNEDRVEKDLKIKNFTEYSLEWLDTRFAPRECYLA